jgi:hypothetical protein
MGDLIATLVVLLIVLWSTYVVWRKVLPKTSLKVQQALAQQAHQHGFVKISKWLAPTSNQGGCGGCSSCGDSAATTCSTTEKVEEKAKPVQWR